MFKFLRKLFGFKETVIVKKNLDVEKGFMKAYYIDWKSVFFNAKELLKKWPRRGNSKRFYHHTYEKPENVLGYIDLNSVKTSVESNREMGFYLAGQIYPDLAKDKNKR